MTTHIPQDAMKPSDAAEFQVRGASLSDFGERLVTLCDGRTGLRSGLQVEVSEPNPGSAHDSPLPPAATERERSESDARGGRGEGAPASVGASPLPSDGRGIKGEGRSSSDSQPSASNPQPILDFIASDETLDRCDEMILAGGWRLESYRRNPVFQNAHQYGDIIFTLGKALITEIRYGTPREAPRQLSTSNSSASANSSGATAPQRSEGGQPSTYLFQRVQFATEANPMARIAYALYKGKFLNAVSVGFIPLRWVNADGNEQTCTARELEGRARLSTARRSADDPQARRAEDRRALPSARGCGQQSVSSLDTRRFRRRYLEQELLEVSAVGIPANPNALQLGLKAGAIQKADLQELLDMLKRFCDSKPLFPSPRPSPQGEGDHSQLSTLNPQLDFRSHPAVPNTPTRALGVRSYEAQWLRLAREIRHVMRET